MAKKQPRIALVTDWMTSFGGENRVLYALHEMYPDAPIYTTMYNKSEVGMYKDAKIITSFLDRFPFAPFSRKKFQMFLPFMPLAFESFDFSDFDVVISSSHSCSKGIITKVGTLHISYCHTPMRYAWEGCHAYIIENAPLKWLGGKALAQRLMHKIRMWDRLAADRVDSFIANSHFIRKQIKKFYKAEAEVVYPPINTGDFKIAETKGDFYLAGGRLIPNKKIDLAIDAFNELGLPLKVFGKGPQFDELRAKAKDNIEFLGFVSDEDVATLFSQAKAFVAPQIEDSGIVTIEAQAAGTPVIGLRKGGTAELVAHGISGVLFEEQTVPSLVAAVKEFESMEFDPEKIRQQALKHDVGRFKREMKEFIEKGWENWEKTMIQ